MILVIVTLVVDWERLRLTLLILQDTYIANYVDIIDLVISLIILLYVPITI